MAIKIGIRSRFPSSSLKTTISLMSFNSHDTFFYQCQHCKFAIIMLLLWLVFISCIPSSNYCSFIDIFLVTSVAIILPWCTNPPTTVAVFWSQSIVDRHHSLLYKVHYKCKASSNFPPFYFERECYEISLGYYYIYIDYDFVEYLILLWF